MVECRGFDTQSGRRVVSLGKIHLPPGQKVLVIPRKRWFRPDINEKLFTETLKKRNGAKDI